MNDQVVELGDKVRDRVTGFEGIAIGYNRWMTGCDQFAVQPGKVSSEGKLSDSTWFDRHRLEIVQKKAVVLPAPLADAPQINREGGQRLTH